MKYLAKTHVGHKRENNEDYFIMRPDIGLFAVADGLGGSLGGEIASEMACKELAKYLESKGKADNRENTFSYDTLNIDYLENAVAYVENRIISGQLDRDNDMATTLDALILGPKNFIVHVGDARIYRLNKDRDIFETLTTDHENVQGYLTYAVGYATPVRSCKPIEVGEGERYLLCTDGLFGELGPKRIEEIMKDEFEKIPEQLINSALENGGRDNITVVVVEI